MAADPPAAGRPPEVEAPDADALDAPSVRWIRGARDLLHRRWGAFLLLLLAVGVAAWVAFGVYKVENGETAALLRFGALARDAVEPGLHLRLPGVEEALTARTGDVFRVEIEGDFAPELSMVTGDENLIETTLVVQYRIKDLSAFLFATEDPELLLTQAVRAALVRSFATTPVDDVLTAAKASIQNDVRQQAQNRLDGYGAGVTVVAVNLQTVDPPREAAGAFRAVNDARAESAQAVNQAQGERDRTLRLTRGEAEQLLTEARSEAESRRQEGRGAADRFRALLRQERVAPEQTRTELYHATIRDVLPKARMIILAPGEDPAVHLNYIRRGDDSGPGIPPGVSFDDR